MKSVDYQGLAPDQIEHIVLEMGPQDVEAAIVKMSADQVNAAFGAMDKELDHRWKKKTRAAFVGLADRESLEAAGRALSLWQALEILDISEEMGHASHVKLSPVLVGLPYRVFLSILRIATAKQLEILKHASIAEPIQHHLTVFIHEMGKEGEASYLRLHELGVELQRLNLTRLGVKELQAIRVAIDRVAASNGETIDNISTALSLAWNSNRPDLVDKLTVLKEGFVRQRQEQIGRPEAPLSGLYFILDEHLKSVYGDSADVDAAHDDESPFEALAKLGLWYLDDYWNIGLLPRVKTKGQLRLNPQKHSAQACERHRENLIATIQANLATLGLDSVGDFKTAGLYSEPLLREFIQQHRLC